MACLGSELSLSSCLWFGKFAGESSCPNYSMTVIERLKSNHRPAVNDLGQTCRTGTYDNLKTPLGRPPKGQEWNHDPITGEWRIVDVAADNTAPLSTTDEASAFQHTVQQDETIAGICLRHGVTEQKLRQANGIMGAGWLPTPGTVLQLPNTARTTNQPCDPPATKESQIRRIMRETQRESSSLGLSYKEALCYWEMNDGNVESAISEALEDAVALEKESATSS